MAPTYDFLGKVTADGSSAVMTLSGIDQTYQDLEIVCQVKTAATYGASGGRVTLNGNTSTVYAANGVRVNGSVLYGDASTGTSWFDVSYSQGPAINSDMLGFAKFYFPNYAAAEMHTGNLWHSSWDSTTAGQAAYMGVLSNPGSAVALTSFTWTGVYTIEANCTICAYGINYS